MKGPTSRVGRRDAADKQRKHGKVIGMQVTLGRVESRMNQYEELLTGIMTSENKFTGDGDEERRGWGPAALRPELKIVILFYTCTGLV